MSVDYEAVTLTDVMIEEAELRVTKGCLVVDVVGVLVGGGDAEGHAGRGGRCSWLPSCPDPI